jgi:type II secretory ATPase GspE/PulE/Tfp pilus assembly ATPase PilB-like protein
MAEDTSIKKDESQVKTADPTAKPKKDAAAKSTAAPTEKAPKIEKGLEQIRRDYKERDALKKAKKLGISYVNLAKTPINPDLLRILEPEVAEKAKIMPFFRIGKRLRIAVVDPNNPETKKVLEDLKSQKFLLNINLTSEEGLAEALKQYQSDQYKVKKKVEAKYEEKELKAYEKELVEMADLKDKIEEATSEEGLQYINVGAMKTGASDIHFEPEEKEEIDVRVSAIPTQFGESFVFRLLDSARSLLTYEEMGFKNDYLVKMDRLKTINNGMILCTGPTGSGKTTTLYAILDQLNSSENKIITLEDPIEYNLKGISQSQINEKRKFTFGSGLKAILRQDPDVVMIGEIRDIDTAETSSQASLTGHVVLSTLHTNSAVETIPRLINMGLPPFMVAPALNTIIAQRLVRRVCDHCKVLKTIPSAMLKDIQQTVDTINKIKPELKVEIPKKLPFPIGCEQCSHTGYKGRILVTEMITLDYEIRDMILKEQSSNSILLAARKKGLISMREDGILKVLKGLTTIEEVFRVTSIVR